MTTAKMWPWSVEVKRREEGALDRLVAGKPCPMWAWWRQAQGAAEECGRLPLLVFRRTRQPWRAMVWAEDPIVRAGLLNLRGRTVWTLPQLASVDYGNRLPVLFMFKSLFRFAPAAGGGWKPVST